MTPSSIQSIRPLLQKVGLDDKEIDVYLALLSMKMARATNVAKAAKQSRSHTYLLLRSLEEKGLVAEVERGKVIHFIAEPPERLLGYIQEKERQLKELQPLIEGALPLLSSMTKPLEGSPRIVLLKGMDGMKQLYRDALSKEIFGIFNPQSMYDHFGGNIVTMLFGKYASLRGRDLVANNAGGKRYMKEIGNSDEYEIRMLPKDVTFGTDMIGFEDTIALFAYDDEETIIRIENVSIAQSMQAWFEVMWSASDR